MFGLFGGKGEKQKMDTEKHTDPEPAPTPAPADTSATPVMDAMAAGEYLAQMGAPVEEGFQATAGGPLADGATAASEEIVVEASK